MLKDKELTLQVRFQLVVAQVRVTMVNGWHSHHAVFPVVGHAVAPHGHLRWIGGASSGYKEAGAIGRVGYEVQNGSMAKF